MMPPSPKNPKGGRVKITHLNHVVTCHYLPTGRTVVFTKKKKHWHDSRMVRPVRKQYWHSAEPTEMSSDWRGDVITERDVITEVARMGGGESAGRIVAELLLLDSE
jgi:hypothetical protein